MVQVSTTDGAAALAACLRRCLAFFRTVPPIRLGDWAEQHFVLPPEASHQQGAWSSYPFQIGLLDAFADDAIAEVTVRKSRRVGYTKALLATIAYNVVQRRRKVALWQPTDDDRDAFVKSEIDPLIRDMPALHAVALTGHDDTLRQKLFRGGAVLHLLGGKAARAYRRITVAVALLDELDGFDPQIEASADPVTLARGRLEGAPWPKLIAGSTPRVRNSSLVESRERCADALMRYHVACRHCGEMQPLQWGGRDKVYGFKWDNDDALTVRHVCRACGHGMTQSDYLAMWRNGAWVSDCGDYRYGMDRVWRDGSGAERKPPKHVAFHLWAAYSPQRTWADIVHEFMQAVERSKIGDNGPLKGFVNETLGETWEEEFHQASKQELAKRAEPYPLRTVPSGALLLTAGVDVQDDRFEIVVWGWGRGEESWCIDYTVLYANPAEAAEWRKLDAYLETEFRHASGVAMRIEAAAVDTGGHHTHAVYNYVRVRKRIYAVKGEKILGRPVRGRASSVDVNHAGQVLKRGVKLWHVGVDTAKDLIHGRLQVTAPGPGYMHFSADLTDDFYAQLLSERRAKVRTSRGFETRWVKQAGERNEVLDCTVYAMFAAHVMGVHTANEAVWKRRETALFGQPKLPPPPAAEPPPDVLQPPPAPPRPQSRRIIRGSFVPSRW